MSPRWLDKLDTTEFAVAYIKAISVEMTTWRHRQWRLMGEDFRASIVPLVPLPWRHSW